MVLIRLIALLLSLAPLCVILPPVSASHAATFEISDRAPGCQSALQKYMKMRENKAFSYAEDGDTGRAVCGWASGWGTWNSYEAPFKAKQGCERGKERHLISAPCLPFAENNRIIYEPPADVIAGRAKRLAAERRRKQEHERAGVEAKAREIAMEMEQKRKEELEQQRKLEVAESERQAVAEARRGAHTAQRSPILSNLNFGRFHALVIGNNEYSNLTKLQNAVNDARAVSEVLANDYDFNVKVLINATRS